MGLVRQLKIDEDMLQYVAINTEIIQHNLQQLDAQTCSLNLWSICLWRLPKLQELDAVARRVADTSVANLADLDQRFNHVEEKFLDWNS